MGTAAVMSPTGFLSLCLKFQDEHRHRSPSWLHKLGRDEEGAGLTVRVHAHWLRSS